MTPDELTRQVQDLPWFHQIDLGGGVVTPGRVSLKDLRATADVYFKDDLVAGKTFLDVGCWDGFHSFEAARRGADRVLATDHLVWSEDIGGWGDRRSFELARNVIAPSVEVRDLDISELTPEAVGTFDVVLFAGVFYHLRHPFLVMEQMAKLTKECLIVETHIEFILTRRPAMKFFPTTELNGDGSNWWGPNVACVVAMLKDLGFPRIEVTRPKHTPSRGVFRGFRS
jgi:tRNA (mo5U34)-methyltransferase